MDDSKLVEMAEGIAEIRTSVKGYDRRLERVEGIVDKSSGSIIKIEKSLAGHEEWRNTVDSSLEKVKSDVEECKHNNIFSGLDRNTVIKALAFIIAALVAGSAGGQWVADLMAIIFGIGG